MGIIPIGPRNATLAIRYQPRVDHSVRYRLANLTDADSSSELRILFHLLQYLSTIVLRCSWLVPASSTRCITYSILSLYHPLHQLPYSRSSSRLPKARPTPKLLLLAAPMSWSAPMPSRDTLRRRRFSSVPSICTRSQSREKPNTATQPESSEVKVGFNSNYPKPRY